MTTVLVTIKAVLDTSGPTHKLAAVSVKGSKALDRQDMQAVATHLLDANPRTEVRQ